MPTHQQLTKILVKADEVVEAAQDAYPSAGKESLKIAVDNAVAMALEVRLQGAGPASD